MKDAQSVGPDQATRSSGSSDRVDHVAVVALPASGSTESTVDQDALESGVMTVGERTADIDSVSCPDDVSQDKGTEFECTVTNARVSRSQ